MNESTNANACRTSRLYHSRRDSNSSSIGPRALAVVGYPYATAERWGAIQQQPGLADSLIGGSDDHFYDYGRRL